MCRVDRYDYDMAEMLLRIATNRFTPHSMIIESFALLAKYPTENSGLLL
jgi:hypothetical protein